MEHRSNTLLESQSFYSIEMQEKDNHRLHFIGPNLMQNYNFNFWIHKTTYEFIVLDLYNLAFTHPFEVEAPQPYSWLALHCGLLARKVEQLSSIFQAACC